MAGHGDEGRSLVFLAGDGEMARRIRAFPWHRTSLGAPQTWPASLKAMVRMALTTRHPIFIMWGPQHICLYNDAFSPSLGPEKHPAILGIPAREAWGEIWQIIGPQVEMVMRGEGATWHENQLVPFIRHGELQDIYWTYSYGPIDEETSESGVGGVLVICTETTDQVLAKQRIAAEREQFARLFDQAPTFMVSLRGPQHVMEQANPRFMQLVGHRPVLGRSVAEALPDAVAQGFVQLLDSVYASGETFVAAGAKYEMQTQAGGPIAERYVDFVYQPIKAPDGSVTGIFVVGADVTDRVASELALRDSEQAFRSLAEGLPDIVSRFDRNKRHLYVSPAVQRATGLPASAFIGRTHAETGMPADRVAIFESVLEKAFTEGTAESSFSFVDKDDVERHYHALVVKEPQERGGETVLSIARDVTDRVRAEVAAVKRAEFEQHLIGIVSHDLRNPLSVILNSASLLMNHATVSQEPQLARGISRILTSGAKATRMINDLLDFTQARMGEGLVVKPAAANMRLIAESAVLALESDDARSRIRVADDGDLEGRWDADRIEQALVNLLTNAIAYGPSQSAITVRTVGTPAEVVVSIHNQGDPIAAKVLPHIFEPFRRGSTADASRRSIGLGLFIVDQIVRAHGGQVSVDSTHEGGTTFCIRLPRDSDAKR